MRLADLIQKIAVKKQQGNLELDITGLTQDSRQVEPGNLFICIKGARFDGHQYLEQVAASGAVAALVEEWPDNDWGLTLIQVEKVTQPVLKELGGAFYNYPDRQLQLIGIVGTNGKTTSTYLVKSILEAAGYQVGLIGTIVNLIKDEVIETHRTTPDALELQKVFAMMVDAGIQYVVMEVSSHSIHQQRIAGLSFRAGIFTNITQDHLDYHNTFEEYLRVKTKFFVDLPNMSWAAINGDDPHAEYIVNRSAAKVMTFGVNQSTDIMAENIQLESTGVRFDVKTPRGNLNLQLNLTGLFNVYNSLGALTIGLVLGIEPAVIKQGLEGLTGVPGRFQSVTLPGVDFGVIVDYAHTPDGLENILKTGRGLNPRRLLLVFGCGGDRDRTKRPIMGELAARMSDFTIITSDNPRSENPEQIIREIETGYRQANPEAAVELEPDRESAIRKMIKYATTGDLVLIAGKGHETYQELADRTIHFDDREVAREALKEKLHG